MDAFLEGIEGMSIDGGSRSARWKNLRGHLKQIVRLADENSDRLAALEEEAAEIREVNLRLTEAIQVLGDLANEEVQREVSLTLNDTDYEVVIDAAPDVLTQPGSEESTPAEEFFDSVDLREELKRLPRIGNKTAEEIAAHIQRAGDEKARQFAAALRGIVRASEEGATGQPSLLGFNGMEGGDFRG